MEAKRILVFDSGMGGLTVAHALMERMPQHQFFYAADAAAFPYGNWAEVDLIQRIIHVMGHLVKKVEPHVIVIACNTASTLAMIDLRRSFALPFVGTVPAIKPAAALTKSGVIGVLATPGTVQREYTHALVHTYAYHCKVVLHGAKRLAEIAERKLKGQGVDLEELKHEVLPVFRQRDGRRTDVVVLGCTHFPLLIDDIREIAPWEVSYIDPAPAIARRTEDVLAEANVQIVKKAIVRPGTVFLTSRRAMTAEVLAAYALKGFAQAELLDLPV